MSLQQPPARENSRQYSTRFSRKMRESLLRTLARKAGKHKERQNV